MNSLLPLMEKFQPISLSEMDAVRLFDRVDVKYIFNRAKLPDFMAGLITDYKLLSTAGSNFGKYETHYFDTRQLTMYMQHHNKKLNRHKVRFRKYLNTGTVFLEVKFKSNKGRTLKERIVLPDRAISFAGEAAGFAADKTGLVPESLSESLQVNYQRITLVNKNLRERLTIDLDLSYRANGNTASFPDLVIAEVKRSGAGKSPFAGLMQSLHIRPLSISKYCLGIASLYPDIKSNNFKITLHYVDKVCHSTLQ